MLCSTQKKEKYIYTVHYKKNYAYNEYNETLQQTSRPLLLKLV